MLDMIPAPFDYIISDFIFNKTITSMLRKYQYLPPTAYLHISIAFLWNIDTLIKHLYKSVLMNNEWH